MAIVASIPLRMADLLEKNPTNRVSPVHGLGWRRLGQECVPQGPRGSAGEGCTVSATAHSSPSLRFPSGPTPKNTEGYRDTVRLLNGIHEVPMHKLPSVI
jgi:hypothetical protein